jgi:hypothetical protein
VTVGIYTIDIVSTTPSGVFSTFQFNVNLKAGSPPTGFSGCTTDLTCLTSTDGPLNIVKGTDYNYLAYSVGSVVIALFTEDGSVYCEESDIIYTSDIDPTVTPFITFDDASRTVSWSTP